jgi:hypothetical protein
MDNATAARRSLDRRRPRHRLAQEQVVMHNSLCVRKRDKLCAQRRKA